ncbi:MFS transporter [Streptomyces griseoviridis]|uniref:MFS transporter n=1 Tax=Streptomyces hintoniae TaxID=3075521 RepID=A0ABU2UC15_9ACTN|nr:MULTISPECIES: MFS transporter [unclassified Streptomyces]MDH6695579.1 DHA2 family multidrug resistance protein-like MFS transporter [Streptomyces sp. MAA16]MDT0470780.1 MFS transporter [Streptomyces sp. DSM 41014]
MAESVLVSERSTVPKKVLFPLLLIPMFLGGVDSTLFNSVAYDLPVLTDSWRLWFIDGYTIALASSIVLGSRLGARLGPGVTLAIGLFVFTVAGASPALLDSPVAWTATRFVQGFGYALIVSSVASVIGGLPNTAERTLGYSLWITTYSIGAGAGPLIGRAFVDGGAYTMLFWLPAAIALVVGVFATLLLRSINLGQAASTKIDVASSVLAFLGFGLFVAGLQSHGPALGRVLATAAGCGVLAVFSTRQLRSRDPLIDVRMLNFSRLGAPSLALVVGSASYTGSVFLFSAEADSLLAILPVSVLALWVSLGGFAFHKLQSRFSPVHMLQVSLATCALGLVVAAFVGLWPASFLIGLGVGVSMASGDSYLLGSVPPKDVARAAALQETSLAVGAALGVAGFGGIFAATSSVVGTAVITAVIVAVVVWAIRFNRGVFSA